MAAPADWVEVTEGATRLLVPPGHTLHGPAPRAKAAGTFYNQAMALGRDISVLYMAARHQGSEVRAVDALSGTGARGVRWVVEAGLRQVTLNDRSAEACGTIRANLERNAAEAEVLQRDVHVLLAEQSYQHIELDPYGSPAPFLDAAFRNLGRRAAVSFTATDAATLCGATKRVCERRYQAKPTRTADLTHEAALRILLGHAVREAAKHDHAALPVLAYAREHYFRCYVETRRSAHLADAQRAQLRWLLECDACMHRAFADAPGPCAACGQGARASGPMWAGPLFDRDLLAAMQKAREGRTLARPRAVERDLGMWQEEASAGGLPHDTHALAKREGVPEGAPVELVIEHLRAQGHAAARSHLAGMFLRTPAPARDVIAAVHSAAEAHARARGGEARPPG